MYFTQLEDDFSIEFQKYQSEKYFSLAQMYLSAIIKIIWIKSQPLMKQDLIEENHFEIPLWILLSTYSANLLCWLLLVPHRVGEDIEAPVT